MPSSIPSPPKFLLDENVSRTLLRYLQAAGYNTTEINRGATDQVVAQQSLSEQRILITNDSDFTSYRGEQVYAVIWLRITQSNKQAALTACEDLLKDFPDCRGHLIILGGESWQILSLPQHF